MHWTITSLTACPRPEDWAPESSAVLAQRLKTKGSSRFLLLWTWVRPERKNNDVTQEKQGCDPSFLPDANNIDLYGIIMPRCYSDRAAEISDFWNWTWFFWCVCVCGFLFFFLNSKGKRNQSHCFSISGLGVFLPGQAIVSLCSFWLWVHHKDWFQYWIT